MSSGAAMIGKLFNLRSPLFAQFRSRCGPLITFAAFVLDCGSTVGKLVAYSMERLKRK